MLPHSCKKIYDESLQRNFVKSNMQAYVYRLHIYRQRVNALLPEVESKTQGSRPNQEHKKNPRPRPRTAFPRTDPFEAKDRNARGQGQGPRTLAQVFSKKKGLQKFFFMRSPKEENKKGLRKFSVRFLAFSYII